MADSDPPELYSLSEQTCIAEIEFGMKYYFLTVLISIGINGAYCQELTLPDTVNLIITIDGKIATALTTVDIFWADTTSKIEKYQLGYYPGALIFEGEALQKLYDNSDNKPFLEVNHTYFKKGFQDEDAYVLSLEKGWLSTDYTIMNIIRFRRRKSTNSLGRSREGRSFRLIVEVPGCTIVQTKYP